MTGLRVSTMDFSNSRQWNVLALLHPVIYISAMMFLISSSFLLNGVDISKQSACHAAAYVCLTFYFLNKYTMYVFLVERVHATRVSRHSRLRDWVWVSGFTISTVGCLAVAISAFFSPYTHVTSRNECMIGFKGYAIYLLISLDTFVNLSLSSIFIFLLLPVLRFRREQRQILQSTDFDDSRASGLDTLEMGDFKETPVSSAVHLSEQSQRTRGVKPSLTQPNRGEERLQLLLKRTVVGTILSLLPTLTNLGLLLYFHHNERAWLCLAVCTFDGEKPGSRYHLLKPMLTWSNLVTTQVCVVHWLTMDGGGR